MPRFSYKAKEGPTKIINGTIEADTYDNAVSKILQLHLTPLDVSLEKSQEKVLAAKHPKLHFTFVKSVKLSDLVLFTRQMSDLVEASVPILRALQIVERQTTHPQLKEVISKMANDVKDGASFSEALAKHPRVFANMYVNMMKTGEVSGQLDTILRRLADYYEKEWETINKIKASLAYPILIIVVGVFTILVLITFVIPRLTVMFEDLNQTLPLPTLILVSLSGFFSKFWWAMLLGVMGIVPIIRQWFHSPRGRLKVDRFRLYAPFLGEFTKIVEVGRLSRTLATLLESGVTITVALRAASETIENQLLKEEIKKVSDDVANGSSLRVALRKTKLFPDMALSMIAVGEEAGRLEKGLYKVAEVYDKQSDQTMKGIVSILGPLVLVLIVGLVGFVVMAMLLPIFKMNLVVQ
jgi:type II secretory pathway component PulF